MWIVTQFSLILKNNCFIVWIVYKRLKEGNKRKKIFFGGVSETIFQIESLLVKAHQHSWYSMGWRNRDKWKTSKQWFSLKMFTLTWYLSYSIHSQASNSNLSKVGVPLTHHWAHTGQLRSGCVHAERQRCGRVGISALSSEELEFGFAVLPL